MKPLKLTMNAFGTYIDKTEIDFENFIQEGIYLITGDTGSGKTTIFDALSFALYGQASGSIRNNPQGLRSDFAEDNNITYVDLEFLNRGEKYFIHRECGYKKINKKGNITPVSEKVELIKPDKTVLSNISEVSEEINNILGIDKNQFTQIIMISQGEFQKFLLAPTKEKEKILRKIFSTNLYQDFQIKLNDLYKLKYSEKKDIELLLKKDISNIIPNSSELEKLKQEENIFNLEELFEILEKSNQNDKKKNADFSKKSKKIQKEIAQLNKKIKEEEIIINDKKDLENINKILPKLEKEVINSQKEYENEKNKDKKRNELTIKINKLKQDLKEYAELDIKQEKLDFDNKNLDISEKNLKKYQTELKKAEEENEKNKKEIDKLKNLSGEIEKNKFNIEKNKIKKNELELLQKKTKEYFNKKYELNIQKEKVCDTEKNFQILKIHADEVYEILKANKAGLLARNLKEGVKCPVCGSIHHPSPAKLNETKLTEEDLEQANKERDNAQKITIQENNKLIEINAKVNSLKEELLKCIKSEFKLDDINKAKEKTETALKENEEETKKYNAEQKELNEKQKIQKELEKNINDFEEIKKELDFKINTQEEEQKKLSSNIASLSAIIKEKQKKLEYKTNKEALENLKTNENELSEMLKMLEILEKDKNEKLFLLNKTKGRKEELENKIPKNHKGDIEKFIAELKNKEELLKEEQKTNTITYSRYKNNETILLSIKKSKKEYEDISKKTDMLDNLNKTANGALSGGKQKITFENYILGAYFDEIIYAANKRFKEMTSYQFELRRAGSKSGNAQTGLDLDVFDYYSTKTRNVSTLSGGESFKAALALSLGLSDIVQQRSGGVEIETMFIDEGFGSLDSESLEQTMKILQELSGNKTLIGIISHISDLREKIDKKIIVTKTQKGSKLRFSQF